MRFVLLMLLPFPLLCATPCRAQPSGEPSPGADEVHVVSGICETDAQCPGSKVCYAGDCRSPHTLNGGHYLMAVGGGMMVPAAVLAAIGLLVQVPVDFSFEGKNGTLSKALLITGGVVALAGLAVIITGLVYRSRLRKIQSGAVQPMLAMGPGSAQASLLIRF